MAIPGSCKVAIVGGGPAGSTAATLLAKAGHHVVLLERAKFPRYHIGESLLPSSLKVFDLLGVREKIESHGFVRKRGAYLVWGASPEPWSIEFGELTGKHSYAYQVIRSEFDKILLDHAREAGVEVFEEVGVSAVEFDGERPVGLSYSCHGAGGTLGFEHLIDASGRTGLLSQKHLNNRCYHDVFQNVAVWNYWTGAKRLHDPYQGAITTAAFKDGWVWAIPLHDGTMSVGVVVHKAHFKDAIKTTPVEQFYLRAIEKCPVVHDLLSTGAPGPKCHTEQDYSYAASSFTGPGYFIAGDAACFLDPVLSSGVHLAMFSGMLAAGCLASLFRRDVTPDEAHRFYERCYRQAYLRFMLFLCAFYEQNLDRGSYFWEAQRLSKHDVEAQDLQLAFLNLVSGMQDIRDADEGVHEYLAGLMRQRVQENLKLRRNKRGLSQPADAEAAVSNSRFFDSVEGLFAFNSDQHVDGLYLSSGAPFGLARVNPVDAPGYGDVRV